MNIPTLETKRLIIRPLNLSDAQDIFTYASNPNVAKWVTWEAHKSLLDSEAMIKWAQTGYVEGRLDPLGITLKGEDKVIGSAGCFWYSQKHKTIELGAALSEKHWGKGIMVEALKEIIEFSWKNFEVNRIQSRCKVGNTQSRRMMEKLGMKYEGCIRSSFVSKKRSWDMEMFSLIRS